MDDHFCPICGFEALWFRAYSGGDAWGSPTFEICPSCDVQFGYTDAWGMNHMARIDWHRKMRAKWKAEGMQWHGYADPPEGWDPKAQLKKLRLRAKERGKWSPF